MTHYIHDAINFSIYGTYDSEAKATRALLNAREKGWKIDKRKYPQSTVDRLTVISKEEFDLADVEVETFNMLNPDAGPIMIKRSLKGNPIHDPACEGYHSM